MTPMRWWSMSAILPAGSMAGAAVKNSPPTAAPTGAASGHGHNRTCADSRRTDQDGDIPGALGERRAMFEDEMLTYKVVVNDEEQYSIWPADRQNPSGWRDEGSSGSRDSCLAHIAEVWRDLRP